MNCSFCRDRRLPEIGVRAVADLAGMPNWDWLPDTEVSPEASRYTLHLYQTLQCMLMSW